MADPAVGKHGPHLAMSAAPPSPAPQLAKRLHSWHLQFVAIGATLGTGLFLGTGKALATAGPAGCLVAFGLLSFVVWSIMVSLGEMASVIPTPGSFTAYATRFVDTSLGFAMGWIYWFAWAMTFALELTAAGLIIQYWRPELHIGIWVCVFWVLFSGVNFLPVRAFGEFEMWFSSIKVITIVGFIIFAICIDAGAGKEGVVGFKNWVAPPGGPGAFATSGDDNGAGGYIVAFWSVCVTAGFSYQGAELVGVGAAETADPRRAVPSAIRWTFWSLVSLFMATVFCIGLVIPHDAPELVIGAHDASASPLVIAANIAGVGVLPHIVNAVLLTAVLSAGNADVYSASRILAGLAGEGHAPAICGRVNKAGTPWVAVAVTASLGLFGFLNMSAQGADVFDWLLSITAIAGFIGWACISICHIKFMRVLKFRNISRNTLPYKAPLQPWLSWFGLAFSIFITITNGIGDLYYGFKVETFFAAYVSLILFALLWGIHKLVTKSKIIPLDEVDITTDFVAGDAEEGAFFQGNRQRVLDLES